MKNSIYSISLKIIWSIYLLSTLLRYINDGSIHNFEIMIIIISYLEIRLSNGIKIKE
jgi:hypothetical protein